MQVSDGLQSVCQVHGGNQSGKLFGGPIMQHNLCCNLFFTCIVYTTLGRYRFESKASRFLRPSASK